MPKNVIIKIVLFILIILGFLLIAAMGYALRTKPQSANTVREVSLPAPTVALGDYHPLTWRGKAHMVNFFASWCEPCAKEHALLTDLARQNIPIVGIAFNDKPDASAKFLADNGNPYAVLGSDPTAQGGINWGLRGVPETFVIDKDGMIRLHIKGALDKEIINRTIMPLWQQLAQTND